MKTEDFLLEDYKLKVEYYAGHLSRTWTRFNFLLTIETALVGLFVTTKTENFSPSAWGLIPKIGIVLCVLWLLLGVLDIRFSRRYTRHIECTYSLLVNKLENETSDLPKGYPYAGYPYAGQWLKGRKLRNVSVTPLSAMLFLMPLLFSVVWLLLWRIA